ncbi:MAG: SocA family protein [Bacteroidales bacterium]|jgi:uncharacterized phage-associated protein|nr:SocA family protein [Bacteroidales bacterium]
MASEMKLEQYRLFNTEKAVQAFAYIQKVSRAKTKLDLIKFLFFADRIHIRRHFSFISHDRYCALKYGPVASQSLNLLNVQEEWFPDEDRDQLCKIILKGSSRREINETKTDLLSQNEMESIDLAVSLFQGKPLVDISHEYPEWKRYEDLFQKGAKSKVIRVEDFFVNPDMAKSPLLQKYFGEDPLYEEEQYLADALQIYQESAGNDFEAA